MKRTVAGALLIGMTLVIAVAAFAVDPADLNRVTFANRTGFKVSYLFFSPRGSEYWGADILGTGRSLQDGENVGFYIHYPDSSNSFDFLAIDENGDAYLVWDYEVSDDFPPVIEITPDDREGGYDHGRLATVNLVNDTGYDIWYAFFSPTDSAVLGIDVLDDETILETGDTLSMLIPATGSPVVYDFTGIDVDEDSYRLSVEISDHTLVYERPIEFSDLQ